MGKCPEWIGTYVPNIHGFYTKIFSEQFMRMSYRNHSLSKYGMVWFNCLYFPQDDEKDAKLHR